ncbi:unnamed protein product, partial [Iphiclides podalirius]
MDRTIRPWEKRSTKHVLVAKITRPDRLERASKLVLSPAIEMLLPPAIDDLLASRPRLTNSLKAEITRAGVGRIKMVIGRHPIARQRPAL